MIKQNKTLWASRQTNKQKEKLSKEPPQKYSQVDMHFNKVQWNKTEEPYLRNAQERKYLPGTEYLATQSSL